MTAYRGVAISGKAGSGKSTLADLIGDHLRLVGVPSKRISFADALKDEVFELFGMRKTDPGGREKLLEWGQARRDEDLNYWVNKTIEQARHLYASGTVPIIDDLRMAHELDAVRDFEMFTVRLDARPWARASRLTMLGLDTDIVGSATITENALDAEEEWNAYFINDADLGSLRSAAQLVACHLLADRHEEWATAAMVG